MKIILTLTLLYLSLFAQTPFILTKFKKVYPLVEIHTQKVPQSYKAKIIKIIKEYAKEMKINTDGFAQRPLGIVITRVPVCNITILKVQLILAEEVKRLDDGEEVFALTYHKEDIFEVENLDEDLIESVEYLLGDFKDQYREDNE